MYTILLKQETPTNANATGTFASFWHVCETLIEALSCSLWDCFSDVKVPTATNATNETRQHGIAWNQTSLGLTNKHFQPKPGPSINKTPRWTSANQPQNSQSIGKALQKKTLSLHHWKDSHMKPNGVLHYDFNFFGLTLPLQKLAFVPRFSSFDILPVLRDFSISSHLHAIRSVPQTCPCPFEVNSAANGKTCEAKSTSGTGLGNILLFISQVLESLWQEHVENLPNQFVKPQWFMSGLLVMFNSEFQNKQKVPTCSNHHIKWTSQCPFCINI